MVPSFDLRSLRRHQQTQSARGGSRVKSWVLALALLGSVASAAEKPAKAKNARRGDSPRYVSVIIDPVGLYDALSVTRAGGRLSYRVSETIEVECGHHRSAGDSFYTGRWHFDAKTTSLTFRRYFNYSFYMSAGPVFREIEISRNGSHYLSTAEEISLTTLPENDGRFGGRKSDLNLELSIGNRWRWSWFVLGADWVGATGVVHTFSETENVSDSKLPAYQKKEYQGSANEAFLHGFRFYLGAML